MKPEAVIIALFVAVTGPISSWIFKESILKLSETYKGTARDLSKDFPRAADPLCLLTVEHIGALLVTGTWCIPYAVLTVAIGFSWNSDDVVALLVFALFLNAIGTYIVVTALSRKATSE
jgi:multisubunit Na+/H+ antiporter MnhG subunit